MLTTIHPGQPQRVDFPAGTVVTYHGSITTYTGQELTVLNICGRRSCCSPVTIPGIVYLVPRLILIATDGRVLHHVNPTNVTDTGRHH